MRVYRSTNLSPVFLSIFIVAICMLGISATSIQAATFTVVNTNDDGAGSLRQAIADANAAAGADTIDFDTAGVFAAPQTITLGGTVLEIGGDLTISGTGTDKLTINGNHASRVFHIINGSTLTLDAMTVTGGKVTEGDGNISGGGIYNEDGNLTITNSTVSGNSAPGDAGGIYNRGTLTVTNTTISGNSATIGAGGILNTVAGTLTVTNSTVSGNLANSDLGGGIYNAGTFAVTNSTVSANSAKHFGGGIYNAGTLTVTNSTITRNRVGFNSGDITRGGGISSDGTEHLTNTIVAGNFKGGSNTPTDIFGVINDADHNLIGDTASAGGIVDGVNGNIVGTDPKLGPLVDNGGPTQTHALLFGSPAIDKGTNSGAISNDQRGAGFARTINDSNVADAADGDGTDIGAVESSFLVVNTTAQDDDGACQPLSDGDCTLREAILAANAAPGTETIVFDIPTTDPGYDAVADRYRITLTEELPYLNSDMFINGLGAKRLTVRRDAAAAAFSVFRIDEVNKTVTISGMTITGGAGDSDVGTSGGIHNFGTLTVIDSTLSGNTASAGGAVINFGTMTMINNTVSGNGANFHGGGIFNIATLTLINSTVSNNSAVINGGGIMNVGEMRVINSTVSANSAIRAGGIYSSGSSMELDGSIIADNTASLNGNDMLGSVTAGDHNLIGGILNVDFLLPAGSTHNIINLDPKLGPLADNGGPTMTHTLLCGSPAIDAGVANALATDQRGAGFVRKFDDPAMANAAGGDGTDIGAFELQAPLVCNTAPVANGDGYSTNEDSGYVGVAPGVLGNDTDADANPLTASLVTGPAHAKFFSLAPDGAFYYVPVDNFNGSDSFTYKANDGSLDSNVATVTMTVNPVNDAPIVSATPLIQTGVQYSDAISTINITASDVETPSANLSIAFTYSKDGGAYQPGLPTGMVQGGTGGAWTVSGVAGVPQGAYAIRSTVTDTGDGSAAPRSGGVILAIGVTRENAVAAPKASNPVSMQVGSPGGTASGTTGQICFDITEPSDGSPGNTSLIDAATVQIAAVGGGGAGGVTASARTFSGGGVGGTRTACFTLNFAGVAPNVFEVTLVIGGNYYTGSGTTVFTVFDPSSGFASGGGWIINPNTGYRANFGVNVKYLKNGNAQGSLLYVEHRPDGDFKVKSNSLNSTGGFAIVPITGGAEADIAGKANYTVNDVGTGNYSFIARVIDKGTPGTNDQFGLKLINPLGQVVNSFTFNPVVLGGGNNQVPKK